MNFVNRFWPGIILVIVWLIFSSPYFFQGKVPYSSTYQVNFFPPWSIYEKFHGPVKNNAMPDIATQIYPWKKFTIDTYKMGQLPLWNPNNFSGNPHLANNQTAVFSPINVLFFIFPFVEAWSILILLQPILAGIFMYLMLRSFRISEIASLMGGISFMFCGFVVVWMAYGTLSYAILFLPFTFYCIQAYLRNYDKRYLIFLALTIPLSFFSGHFQTSLYFLLAVLSFLAYKLLEDKKSFLLFFAIIIGVLLSLPQLLPSFEFYQNSVRSSSFIKSETIPFQYLATIFAPDFFGNPVTRNDWYGHYAEWSSFIGIIPFILAFLSLLKRNKNTIFFIFLAVTSVTLALDTVLSGLIVGLKLPVISTSSLSRIIVIFSFSTIALSAFGLDNLIKQLKNREFKALIKPFVISSVCIIFLTILPFLVNVQGEKVIIAIKSLRVPIVLLAIFIVGILIQIRYNNIRFLPLLVVLLASIQSIYFASKWMPFDSKELVFPNLPVIGSIKSNIGHGRLFGNFGAEISSYYGIPSIEGYDPLYIERYGEFIQSADFGTFQNAQRSVVKISRRGEHMNRAIDLLGVNLIFHPVADTNQNWAFPVWEDKVRFAKMFDDGKIQIYRNNTAMNRVSIFYKYEILKDKKEIIKKFYSKEFDFRNVLILEEDPNINLELNNQNSEIKKRDLVEIVSYTPSNVSVKVLVKSQALIFLSDNYYPGWKAYVNGKETKIFRANYAFKAVAVPAGESEVLFKFEPTF